MKPLLRFLFVRLQSLAHGLVGGAWFRSSNPGRAAHARRVCPQRFDRLRHPFDPIEPHTADALLGEAGARATWRAVRPLRSAGRALTGTRARDDFTSEVERQRFRPLDPISAAEIAALDLEQLLRRLAETG